MFSRNPWLVKTVKFILNKDCILYLILDKSYYLDVTEVPVLFFFWSNDFAIDFVIFVFVIGFCDFLVYICSCFCCLFHFLGLTRLFLLSFFLPGWRAKKRRSAPPVGTVKSNAVSFTFTFFFSSLASHYHKKAYSIVISCS